MSESRRCAEVRELIPELAMGVAPGDERAAALAHIATCADCRQLLEEATETVDELLLLAPEHEPPPGFDAKVVDAIGPSRLRRWNRARFVLAAVVVVIAAASAGVWVTRWAGADDRQLAQQYRETLRVADGSYLRAATLVGAAGETSGHVFAYQGRPSWVFITVEDAASGAHRVRLVTQDGHTREIGVCTVRNGRGSWGTAINEPIYALDRIELIPRRGRTLSAEFAGG